MQHICPPEEWRDIPGYEGIYQVSSCGRARSLDRVIAKANGVEQSWKGQILKPRYNTTGRIALWLRRDGKHKTVLLHRAVLEAFVGPCPEGMEACHWDDDPKHNCVANLRWASRNENVQDRFRNGRYPNARKTRCKYGHKFTPENTYVSPTRPRERECRTCKAINNKRYKSRLKADRKARTTD